MPSASPDNHQVPPSPWRPRVLAAVLVAVIAGAYAESLSTPFLFDDTVAVLRNPTIRHLGSWDVLNPPSDGSTTTGRPLLNLSLAINYAISGEQVWSYHVGNVLLQALCALAVMVIVCSVARHRGVLGPNASSGEAGWLGFFVALLWGVHPLLTESVVCVAQRTELLCGVFYLGTLACFSRATCGGGSHRGWLAGSVLCSLAGMASKEVMVTAPVLVLLFDRTFVTGSFAAAWRRRRGYYLALAATWLMLAFLLVRAGGSRGSAAGFGLGVSWWSYLLKQSEAIVLYVRLAVWPHPLVLDYGTDVVTSLAEVWWQGPLVIAAVAAGVWSLVRRPVPGFCAAWFFIILSPSSSVVPLVTQTMAEHRMYLPLIALVTPVIVLLIRFGRARVGWIVPACAAIACVGATHARVGDYRDLITIWTDNVTKRPASARGHNNLAWALDQAGRKNEAEQHFLEAVRLQPEYVSARYNWGVALLDRGRPDEAIRQFQEAVRITPGHADARVNLGNALMQVGRTAEALREYETALELSPAADVHYNLGVALIDAGRAEAAVHHLREFLTTQPGHAEAHYQLARALEMQGDRAGAAQELAMTLRLAPDHAGAHRKAGMALARANRIDEAAIHFEALVRLDPQDADARVNLGNVRLFQGKTGEAIRLYEAALRLRPDDPRTRENLRLARESAP